MTKIRTGTALAGLGIAGAAAFAASKIIKDGGVSGDNLSDTFSYSAENGYTLNGAPLDESRVMSFEAASSDGNADGVDLSSLLIIWDKASYLIVTEPGTTVSDMKNVAISGTVNATCENEVCTARLPATPGVYKMEYIIKIN